MATLAQASSPEVSAWLETLRATDACRARCHQASCGDCPHYGDAECAYTPHCPPTTDCAQCPQRTTCAIAYHGDGLDQIIARLRWQMGDQFWAVRLLAAWRAPAVEHTVFTVRCACPSCGAAMTTDPDIDAWSEDVDAAIVPLRCPQCGYTAPLCLYLAGVTRPVREPAPGLTELPF